MNRRFAHLGLAAGLACLSTSPVLAAPELPRDDLDVARDAVTSPLQDFNIANRAIPTELLMLQHAPYDTEGLETCEALADQIAVLEDILGPDVDTPDKKEGVFRTALSQGGKFLSGFIPFRGVVRQLSGAAAREKRLEDAIYAGVARRSFLKGFAASQGCATAEERAIASARAALGRAENDEDD